MNNLPQIFMYQGTQIRMIAKDNEPWWVAKDVCDVLDLDVTQVRRLDEDEKGMCSIQTPGGMQQMTCVNEPGLYSLILGSKKPEAKPFKRWVIHVVLPEIRKTGSYSVQPQYGLPQNYIEALKALVGAEEEKQALEAKIEADRPKVIFAESLQISQDSILIGQLAKLLKQNGIDIGQNRLFQVLREEGYLMSRGERYNMPSQRSMDMQLMEIKVGSRFSLTDGSKATQTTKVTFKGAMYFINKFKAMKTQKGA